MTRSELTAKILDAKRKKGLSWQAIAQKIGGNSPVFLTAALLGPDEAREGAGANGRPSFSG